MKRREMFFKALSGVLLLVLLWSISLPIYIDVILVIGIILLCRRVKILEIGLLVHALLFSFLSIEFVIRLASLDQAHLYREHEKYIDGDRYKPLVTDTIFMQYGDVYASDFSLPRSVMEPRVVHFQTDKYGYRNTHEYSDQKYVLIGDSFLTGNGTDWKETLPALIEAKHETPVYSIAFPGGPSDYIKRAEWFLGNIAQNIKFAFFFYEGNDFGNGDSAPLISNSSSDNKLISPALATLFNTYDRWRGLLIRNWFPELRYPSLLFNTTRVLERKYLLQREQSGTHIAMIGNKLVAAFTFQSSVALMPDRSFELPNNPEVLKRLACVFFIPTKARVYAREFGYNMPEPSASFVALQRYFTGTHTTVVDLTPILRSDAQRLLPQDQYVYWRDDSHWNGNGMRAVSESIANCLKESH